MREDYTGEGTPQEGTHVPGGVQSESEVGLKPGSFEYDAIHDLAPPKTLTYMSQEYSDKDAEKISALRYERWAILLHFDANAGHKYYSATSRYKKIQQRLDQVNAELYILTKNPIYDVDGKARLFASELQQP